MKFENKNLSVIAYANGFTLWHYRADDTELKQIVADQRFFSKVYHLSATGDIVIINGKDGTGIYCMTLTEDKRIILGGLK